LQAAKQIALTPKCGEIYRRCLNADHTHLAMRRMNGRTLAKYTAAPMNGTL